MTEHDPHACKGWACPICHTKLPHDPPPPANPEVTKEVQR